MKEVTLFKTEDGHLYEKAEAALHHEETIAFNKEGIVEATDGKYLRLKEYFFDLFEKEKLKKLLSATKIDNGFQPAAPIKPFSTDHVGFKTPEEHRADALAYGERGESPSNPGIGSNR